MSKQDKQRGAAPKAQAGDTIFRVPEKPKDGSSIAETLANDGQFRKFFTTSVIDIPEDIRKSDEPLDDIEDDEPGKKRGMFWFLGRKRGEENVPEEEADVRIPELAQGQAEETLAAMEPAAKEQEPTGEIHLSEAEAEPQPRPAREKIAPKPVQPDRAKAENVSATAEQAMQPAALETKATAQTNAANAEAEQLSAKQHRQSAAQKARETEKAPAAKAKTGDAQVDIFSLLEQIKEAQAVMGAGIVPGMAEAAAGSLAGQTDAPEAADDAADTAPETEKVPDAPEAAGDAADTTPETEKAPDAPEIADDAADTTPETEKAPDTVRTPAPTGRISFMDQDAPVQRLAPEEDAAPQPAAMAAEPEIEPTGEIPLAGEPTGEVPLGAELTGEVPLDTEPTGEVSLAQGLTGEVPLGTELTGEVPLDADEPEESDEKPRSRWNRLLSRFAGDKEPEEPEETEETITPRDPTQEFELPRDEEEPEYTSPEDTDDIRAMLQSRAAILTLRTVLTGIFGVALLVLDLMGQGTLPAPAMLDPATAPAAWLGVHLILMGICIALALPILQDGVLGMLPGHEASAAALPTLATAAAALQTIAALLTSASFDPAATTMFTGAAALGLFAALLGRRLSMDAVRDGFAVMSSGVDNAVGYCPKDKHLKDTLCAGMDEQEPVLLLSRKGALLKNFIAQSFAPHHSDRLGVKTARLLGIVALAACVITLAKGSGILAAVTALAAVLCLGAPLSATLIRAVPSVLMQRAAAEASAVIPGWPAIEQLGSVDMLHVDATELFPPMCAHLFGIKTFRKERIDLAILYATSILIEACDTLSGLFRSMIENNTAMLYPVKDLEKRAGLGFVAWCDNCRIVLGSRTLMENEGIALPAMDYENRYSQDGDRQVMYLAVSGELSAMFLFGYTGTKKVARILGTLKHENIRLLVSADDPTLTAQRIEAAYRLRPGFVKVLGTEEAKALETATAYVPATEGCLVHVPGFGGMVGGLGAAAGAENAENSAGTVQTVSVAVAVVLGILLSLTGSLPHIALGAVLLYQLAWSILSIVITLAKKY